MKLWNLFFILSSLHMTSASFFSFFFPNRGEKSPLSVPYEISQWEDQFLQEAAKLMGKNHSSLDTCNHRIILKLKDTCRELSSEELGKLAVLLLNCQLQTEERQLYTCTSEMSLKDCTIEMDADTWNAYNVITTRARAICTLFRHEEFRTMAEMTVNKLLESAQTQVDIVSQLTANQKELNEAAISTIEKLEEDNIKLINSHRELIESTASQREFADNNYKSLSKEKVLIQNNQLELTNMVANIKSRLDEGFASAKEQIVQAKQSYQSVLDNLNELQASAIKVTQQINEANDFLTTHNELETSYFNTTISQLKEINAIVGNIAGVLKRLQGDVTLFSQYFGGKDDFLQNFTLAVSHFGYLLVGMICLVFVNASMSYRLAFVTAVPMSFALNATKMISLNLIHLSITIAIVFLCNFVYQNNERIYELVVMLTQHLSESEKADTSTDEVHSSSFRSANGTNGTEYEYVNHRSSHINSSREPTPASRSGTPFVSTMTGRVRCQAQTLRGGQCRNAAAYSSEVCLIHSQSRL